VTTHIAQPARLIASRVTRPAIRRRLSRPIRDPHVLLALSVAVPTLIIHALWVSPDWPIVIAGSVGYLAVQAGTPRDPALMGRRTLDLVRLALGIVYVTAMSRLGPLGGTPPLIALYVPIITMAAVYGGREAVVIGTLTLAGFAAALVANSGVTPMATQRAIVLIAVMTVLSIGTRRTIVALEHSMARLRTAIAADRRTNRRLAAIGAVGGLLAEEGPTDDALARVMDLLEDHFGYRHISIYLGDAALMRLGAHRGYAEPILSFDASRGVVGRVMRTRTAQLVPDVTADQDYAAAVGQIQSLISVPLVSSRELLGVVSVESDRPDRLDADDLAAVRVLADRLAAALALARDRERLSRRAAAYESLTAFVQGLTTTLEPAELYGLIARSVTAVVRADIVVLTARDDETGDYRVVANSGGDERFLGTRIVPGNGMAGRAIDERQFVVEDRFEHAHAAEAFANPRIPEAVASAAVPLVRGDLVVGALTVVRSVDRPFEELERELLSLIGSQVALAIINAQLHHATAEASIRDPLTGVYNRRHLDASLARLSALRARTPVDERRPLSIILFDVDHFGQFNKQYGHAVGDEVLRIFGRLLARRVRRSDLLARFGGEEFVVVLDGATRGEAVRLAEEIREQLRSTSVEGPNGEALTATVSAGCAGLESEAATLDGLLETADVGLSMAKHSGRDRVVAA